MDEEEDDQRDALEEIEDDVISELKVAMISLHALMGQRNLNTIWMPRFPLGSQLEVLVDRGFTHNFI